MAEGHFTPGYKRWKYLFLSFLFCSIFASCGTNFSAMQTGPSLSQASPTALPRAFHATTSTFDKDFTITLNITPNCACLNVFLVSVQDSHTGKPVSSVEVTLYTTMRDMGMGTDAVKLHANGDGKFSTTSNTLSMSGRWAIGITIATSDQHIHKAGIDLVVPL